MPRAIQPPTIDERGDETHPAFAHIQANRTTSTPGAVLFDSDLRHPHYVTLTISTASRKRDLSRDWLHPGKQLVQVSMSEAQWAQLVSAMNSGGTPATLEYLSPSIPEVGYIPGLPYAPRMQHNLQEIKDATTKMLAKARAALKAYKEHKTVGNLRALETALEHAESNTAFVAESLNEHVEETIVRAKSDIEAMVAQASQHGVSIEAPEQVLRALELGGES